MVEKKLSFQNKNLWYRVRGEGMPVMLVHGFGEDHHIWDEQVQQLEVGPGDGERAEQ